jgi:hypothetical protein
MKQLSVRGASGRRLHVRRWATPSVTAAGLALVAMAATLTATSAQARPIEHFSGNNQGSFVRDDFCGEVEVRIDFDYDFTVVARESGPARLPRYTVSSHGIETFTNLATGKSVTAFSDSVTQDVRVTDSGDGTLTILYQTPGAARNFGPDGRVLLIDSRPSWYEVVLDHGGTPSDPSDDTFISEELVRDVAAHVTKDFCSAFRAATG